MITNKNVQRIKNTLDTMRKNITFHEETHTYLVSRVRFKPVSDTIKDYSLGIDKVPKEIMEKAQNRGNEIHYFMEWYLNSILNDKEITEEDTQNLIQSPLYPYFKNGIEYINDQLDNQGYSILSIEQPLYHKPNKVAGTCDLILYKLLEDSLEIKIVDWKSGEIKFANHIQIEIYKQMVSYAISRLNIDNLTITTELVSLKPKEKND